MNLILKIQTQTAKQQTVTLMNVHDRYDPTAIHGDTHTIVVWRDTAIISGEPYVTFKDGNGRSVDSACRYLHDESIFATIVFVPTSLVNGHIDINLSS